MRRSMKFQTKFAYGFTGAFLALSAAGVWMTGAIAQPSPAPFTDAQAQAGQAAYAQSCARCHDSGEAPVLNGANFSSVWASRTTKDLYARIKDTMPVDNPGTLSSDAVVSIVAYLLKNNGVSAGTAPRAGTTAVSIGSLLPQEAKPQAAQGAAPAAASADAELRRGVVRFRTGVTVAGTVEKYTPITD